MTVIVSQVSRRYAQLKVLPVIKKNVLIDIIKADIADNSFNFYFKKSRSIEFRKMKMY